MSKLELQHCIYGKHVVTEALRYAPHVVKEVLLGTNAQDAELKELIARHHIQMAPLREQDIARVVPNNAVHQGLIAVIDPAALVVKFDTFVNSLNPNADTALVVLGELQDPQNVGAIIRSAAAFGIAGVLLPPHNQAQITGAVVKASAGMAFRVPLVSIGNVNQTLRVLKEKGFWIYGLAMEGANELSKENFDAPAVFVVGNEGSGIREKTLDHCDIKLRIPMHPRTESLNAAASAAIVLYEWSSSHPKARTEK